MRSTKVIVEFPAELRDTQGRPSGTNRGWLPAGDPGLATLPEWARVVTRTDDEEAGRLLGQGFCLVARRGFNALACLQLAGQDPGRVLPAAWTHLEQCGECRAAYRAYLQQVVQAPGGEEVQAIGQHQHRLDAG